MSEEKIVEVMARGYSPSLFDGSLAPDDGRLSERVLFEMQESVRNRARAALASLEKEGYVVLPKVAGPALIAAFQQVRPLEVGDSISAYWRDVLNELQPGFHL